MRTHKKQTNITWHPKCRSAYKNVFAALNSISWCIQHEFGSHVHAYRTQIKRCACRNSLTLITKAVGSSDFHAKQRQMFIQPLMIQSRPRSLTPTSTHMHRAFKHCTHTTDTLFPALPHIHHT